MEVWNTNQWTGPEKEWHQVSLFLGFTAHEEKAELLDYPFFPAGGGIIPV
ncbi:MAG: hypothetical protein V3T45_01055 [Nitrospinaceae bacterium]